jgi:flagellar hook-basal body complex protein FliE
MSTVLPGTFAPDMSANEAPLVTSIPGLDKTPGDDGKRIDAVASTVGAATVPSFKDTVKALMSDVNDSLNTSDQNTRDLASGKTNDVNKVITSVEEANLAFSYTMAIRTKLLDAYSEVERMAV